VKSLRQVAMDYLARREHTRHELTRKLLVKGFLAAEVDQELDCLTAQGLQSDARFVENYVSYRQQAGFGPRLIRKELQQKGVAEDLIAEHVSQEAACWYPLLEQVWQKKFSGKIPKNNAKECQRQVRFLLSRGFELEMIQGLLKSDFSG
jgi:regulatory protein